MLGLVGDSVPKEEEEEEKKDRIFPLKRNRFARWIFIYFFIDVTRKNAERSDEKKIARKKRKKRKKERRKKKNVDRELREFLFHWMILDIFYARKSLQSQ